jgi:hypothetical protein
MTQPFWIIAAAITIFSAGVGIAIARLVLRRPTPAGLWLVILCMIALGIGMYFDVPYLATTASVVATATVLVMARREGHKPR